MDKKVEMYSRNLEQINKWIENADIKASIILGFAGVFLGFYISWMSKFFDFSLNYSLTILFVAMFICVLGIIFLCLGIYNLFKTLLPDIKIQQPSLFYFGSISQMMLNDYIDKFKNINDEEITNDLIIQSHINAKIATVKFSNLSKGIIKVLLGFLCGIIFFILTI